jgi:GSH-dependent disulfide-bond oxidoreductase
MTWPWINALPKLGVALDRYPQVKRWFAEVADRPAVQGGVAVPMLTEHEDAA